MNVYFSITPDGFLRVTRTESGSRDVSYFEIAEAERNRFIERRSVWLWALEMAIGDDTINAVHVYVRLCW